MTLIRRKKDGRKTEERRKKDGGKTEEGQKKDEGETGNGAKRNIPATTGMEPIECRDISVTGFDLHYSEKGSQTFISQASRLSQL